MSPKENTTALVMAFLTTITLASVGFWWISQNLKPPQQNNSNVTSSFSPPTITLPPSPSASPTNSPSSIIPSQFSQVKGVPSGEFKYGGSTTWAPIRRDVYPAIQTSWSGFKLIYTDPLPGTNQTPGSGTGIRMLIDSELSFSLSSRKLDDEEKQKGVKLTQIPVAIDAIAFSINPKLNIPGLTLDEIKKIYIGQITNWQDVGGPNLGITPYSRRKEDGGTVEFFLKFLNLENFGANVEFARDTTAGLRKVSQNPGGIYYASASEIVPQCGVRPLPIASTPNDFVPPYTQPFVKSSDCPQNRNKVNTADIQSHRYPITRELYVIVNQNGQIAQQAGEAYANLLLTDQGQELIQKAGFVKIRR